MQHEEMREKGLSVYDARGGKVDRVRSAVLDEGGVTVSVLHTVNRGKVAVVDSDDEVVEFTAYIKGGQLR